MGIFCPTFVEIWRRGPDSIRVIQMPTFTRTAL